MKQLIIEALKNGEIVRFKFSDEFTFTSNVLLDELATDPNYIYVGQSKNKSNSRIVNLLEVGTIQIADK